MESREKKGGWGGSGKTEREKVRHRGNRRLKKVEDRRMKKQGEKGRKGGIKGWDKGEEGGGRGGMGTRLPPTPSWSKESTAGKVSEF